MLSNSGFIKFQVAVPRQFGAIALSYPPRVRVGATVKVSAAFFHDESSIAIGGGGGGGGGGNESAIAPLILDIVVS